MQTDPFTPGQYEKAYFLCFHGLNDIHRQLGEAIATAASLTALLPHTAAPTAPPFNQTTQENPAHFLSQLHAMQADICNTQSEAEGCFIE